HVARSADGEVVVSVARHVDRVREPFAGLEVVDGVRAAGGVGRGDDVDVLARAELTAGIAWGEVVVGDVLAAVVELRGLEGLRQRDGRTAIRRATVRRLRGGVEDGPDRAHVEVLLVGDDLDDVLARGERHVLLAEPLEGAPAAGVRYRDRSGDVCAVD